MLPGGSLVFTRQPRLPLNDPAEPVPCPESRAAPIADTVLASALLAGAAALVVDAATTPPGRRECTECLGYAAAAGVASYGAIAALSALVGFQRTARCSRIHDWQRSCDAGDTTACAALTMAAPPGR